MFDDDVVFVLVSVVVGDSLLLACTDAISEAADDVLYVLPKSRAIEELFTNGGRRVAFFGSVAVDVIVVSAVVVLMLCMAGAEPPRLRRNCWNSGGNLSSVEKDDLRRSGVTTATIVSLGGALTL